MAQKILDIEGLKYLTTKLKKVFAPLASPSFTGVPKVPTAKEGTQTTQAASTAFVAAAVGKCANAEEFETLSERVGTLENGGALAAETIEEYVALYNGYMGTTLNYRDFLADHSANDVLTELDAMNTAYFA